MKVRPHHRQKECKAGFGFGSSGRVTDPVPRFATTTERLVGTNAVFAGAEINDSEDFVRNSEGFAIATLYKMRGQQSIFNHMSYR